MYMCVVVHCAQHRFRHQHHWCFPFHCHPNVLTCMYTWLQEPLHLSLLHWLQVPELLFYPAPHPGPPQRAGVRLETCTWAVPCLELCQEQLELHQWNVGLLQFFVMCVYSTCWSVKCVLSLYPPLLNSYGCLSIIACLCRRPERYMFCSLCFHSFGESSFFDRVIRYVTSAFSTELELCEVQLHLFSL